MCKHRLYLFCILLVCAFIMPPTAVFGDDPKAVKLADQIQERYRQFWSLEFSFDQLSLSSGRLRMGKGSAVFYRDRALHKTGQGGAVMRWNYTEPTAQTITNNGDELAIYTPEEKQVLITSSADMDSDPSYALFTGTARLSDTFSIQNGDTHFFMNDAPKNCTALLLIPRVSHPQIKRIQVWVDNKLNIHRLLMEDHFESLTELSFSNMRVNALPAGDPAQRRALLELQLAPGTEVVRQ